MTRSGVVLVFNKLGRALREQWLVLSFEVVFLSIIYTKILSTFHDAGPSILLTAQ